MSAAEEIAKLHQLKEVGALTDEEFTKAKARLLGGETSPQTCAFAFNSLRRSQSDRWIGGVCGGIARQTGIESWILRLLWSLAVFFAGVGLLAYVLCWIFVPDENAG